MKRSRYDVAQICMNGHVINTAIHKLPYRSQSHCDKCGAETITNCPSCDTPIRGSYLSPRRYAEILDITSPAFCLNCGEPFPWTKTRLKVAKEMALELDALSDEEQSALAKNLDDLVRETPRTPLAVTRTKKILSKVGAEAYDVFRKLLVDITSEAIRKQLWPE